MIISSPILLTSDSRRFINHEANDIQGSLRHFMWELVHQRVDTERLLRDWPEDITSPTLDQATNGLWHYSHCFDYLRQGLQCSADTSLEFVSLEHTLTGLQIIDGLDYPHECTNWDALWDYAVAFGPTDK